MLDKLKSFDVQSVSMDELVMLSAVGTILVQEFLAYGIEQPKWLDPKIKTLRREVRARNQDHLEKRILELKSRRETLLSTSERKKQLDAEIAALTAKVE